MDGMWYLHICGVVVLVYCMTNGCYHNSRVTYLQDRSLHHLYRYVLIAELGLKHCRKGPFPDTLLFHIGWPDEKLCIGVAPHGEGTCNTVSELAAGVFGRTIVLTRSQILVTFTGY